MAQVGQAMIRAADATVAEAQLDFNWRWRSPATIKSVEPIEDEDVRVLIALHRCEAWLRAERLRRARDELEGV